MLDLCCSIPPTLMK